MFFALFAFTARPYQEGVWLIALVAVGNGGTYTASLMIVSRLAPPARRGAAIGWNLGATSLGSCSRFC